MKSFEKECVDGHRIGRRWIAAACFAIGFLVAGTAPARADIIVGPQSWDVVGGSDSNWGIQFDALKNADLTGFDFNHHSTQFGPNLNTGTITLVDISNGKTLFEYDFPSGSPAVIGFSGLQIGLTAGDAYQLLATSSSGPDELYSYVAFLGFSAPNFPDSDGSISVTSGVFSGAGTGTGFPAAYAWGAFSNITSTPEPGSFVLFGLAFGGFGVHRLWRRRRIATCPAN